MKKIYLTIITVTAAVHMNGQLTLTKALNEPVSGDILISKQIDSVSAIPKNTGSGQSWNFSSMTVQSFTQSQTYTLASSAPSSSLYPGSDIAILRSGDSEVNFYKSNGSNWEFMGNYDPTGPSMLSLTNTAVFAAWPISFSNSNLDPASGSQTSGTVVSTINGNVSYTATGAGTVTVPGGQVFTNCLQVISTISITQLQGTVTTNQTMIHYDYYTSGRKFPILSMEYKSSTTGTMVSKNFSANADATILPLGLSDRTNENIFSVYPNPAKDILNVSGNGKNVDEVEVVDLTGKTLVRILNSNKIDISSLKPSLYLVKIREGNSTTMKKVVVQE